MDKKNPFDDLYDQISDLVNLMKEKTRTSPFKELEIPADFEKKFDELKKNIAVFNSLSEEIVILSGISKEEMLMRLNGLAKDLSQDGKKLIRRGEKLKEETQTLNEDLEKQLKNVSLNERSYSVDLQPEDTLLNKQSPKKRRSKFKRFGSDEKWKPL